MHLSSAGRFLTGPFLRPDITDPNNLKLVKTEDITREHLTVSKKNDPDGNAILVINKEPHPAKRLTHTYKGLKLHWSNVCGVIPGVSTVTGIGRAILGLVHAIIHLVKAIFDKLNRKEHLIEAALGFYNLGRGVVEAFPLLGNIIVGIFDIYRLNKQQNAYDAKLESQIMQQYGLSK